MTIKEQIYIEDKYRQLQDDHSTVTEQLNNNEWCWDHQTEELLEELSSINDMIRFINDFISYAGYEWRKLKSGWTLFERKEG